MVIKRDSSQTSEKTKIGPIFHQVMKTVLIFFVMMYPGTLWATDIWNVSAQQEYGTTLVVVTYDLVDPEQKPTEIILEVSKDDGAHYTIHPRPEALSGDVGKGVMAGQSKCIYWDVSKDFKELSGNKFRIKLTAHR